MKRINRFTGAALFAIGLASGLVLAKGVEASAALYQSRQPAEAASALLGVARAQAEGGTWENIAVGRAYYLGGDKAQGQQLFDGVLNKGKDSESDIIRVARVYAEAGEWDKARTLYEKAIAVKPKDAGDLAELGAWHNLRGERAKAEELFARALALKNDNVYITATIAGSYLGVKPQP